MNEFDPKEASGSVHIKIMRGTCYGSPAMEIDFNFDADEEKVSARFSEGLKNKTVSLDLSEVKNLLSSISAIVEKPEVLSGLRHVDVRYHAEVEWKNLPFIDGEKPGNFKAFSDEWFVEEIEFFMNDAQDADANFIERMQKILDQKPHRHALEIYEVVKHFFRKYLK